MLPPRNPFLLKALAAYQDENPAQAVEWCDWIAADSPEAAFADHLRGQALRALGQPDKAAEALVSAVKRTLGSGQDGDEVLAERVRDTAEALSDAGQDARALALLMDVLPQISASPLLASLWTQTACLAIPQQDWTSAEQAVARAMALAPQDQAVWTALGSLRLRRDDPVGALEAFDHALTLLPPSAAAHLQTALLAARGAALFDCGRYQQALDCYNHALPLVPDDAWLRMNRAAALLVQGDFAAGWHDLEFRWQVPSFQRRYRVPEAPLWDGCRHPDDTLLVCNEQAFGDALMMARCLPELARRFGGRVVVECHPPLQRLFATLPGVDEVFPHGGQAPEYQWHCPLMSLPRLLEITATTVPPAACLTPPPPTTRIPAGDGPAIGLSWGGRPQPRNRSVPFADLWATVRQATGAHPVRWVCLQADERRKEANGIDGLWMPPAPQDFADSAAVMAQLDWVISIDSAVLHLAGAIGTPCAALLLAGADWRYGLPVPAAACGSPWYPQMPLFRQPALDDWPGALAALGEWLRPVCARNDAGTLA
ncbi:tetratricopeptide repeat protein [Insolitispirillum peregrinum]|nr:tetratricopeptide repeat protein [Insolitispirillum peregrinum]